MGREGVLRMMVDGPMQGKERTAHPNETEKTQNHVQSLTNNHDNTKLMQ